MDKETSELYELIYAGGDLDPQVLTSAASHPVEDIRIVVASHKDTSLTTLRALAQDANAMVREAVAANENATPELLMLLKDDPCADTRYALALNTHCPIEVLRDLTKATESNICSAAASHPNCSQEMLAELAISDNEELRRGVTENPNCSEELLHQLSQDSQMRVRLGVIENRNCGYWTVQKISHDAWSAIRREACKNDKLAASRLIMMAMTDEDPMVRKTAIDQAKGIGELELPGLKPDGITLDMQIVHAGKSTSLGEAVLAEGLTSIYQQLLADKLQSAISERAPGPVKIAELQLSRRPHHLKM